jgi:hypothetical protein
MPTTPIEPEKRDIDDILYFREDISPFLVHLTRNANGKTASSVLTTIVRQKRLRAGDTEVSVAPYGGLTTGMSPDEKKKFFNAICFTETPLSEVHCLLEIKNRQVNLAPFGLVFLKENLRNKGVAPVLYLNNEAGDQDAVAQAMFSLKDSSPKAAALILPLMSVFGKKLKGPRATERPEGKIDWLWEREWRYPSVKGALPFTKDDVFVGLCLHEEIAAFESLWPEVDFIDPVRSMKWYAKKLTKARGRLKLKYSVV